MRKVVVIRKLLDPSLHGFLVLSVVGLPCRRVALVFRLFVQTIPSRFGHPQCFARLREFLKQAILLGSYRLSLSTALLVPANQESLEFGIRRRHDRFEVL